MRAQEAAIWTFLVFLKINSLFGRRILIFKSLLTRICAQTILLVFTTQRKRLNLVVKVKLAAHRLHLKVHLIRQLFRLIKLFFFLEDVLQRIERLLVIRFDFWFALITGIIKRSFQKEWGIPKLHNPFVKELALIIKVVA